MASYIVMEPPEGEKDEREAVLVRDGFHVLAFLVPFLWLLFHRCWFEAAIALAAALAIGIAGSMMGFAGAPALSFLVSIYVGLEGPALRAAALRRRGWGEWGVVEAEGPPDAEIRYLAEKHGDQPAAQPQPPSYPLAPSSSRPAPAGPALGLFSYPGRG
jgi:hypothetical protein